MDQLRVQLHRALRLQYRPELRSVKRPDGGVCFSLCYVANGLLTVMGC